MPGGRYQLTIEPTATRRVTQEIHAEIGKPYTFFVPLEPQQGPARASHGRAARRAHLPSTIGWSASAATTTELAGRHYTLRPRRRIA